jgi:phenylacetate-CoA ligase
MGIIKRIIDKQPNVIKRMCYNLVPFKYRYGELFNNTVNFLNDVDNWTYTKTEEYQFNQLKKILKHCNDNVPYYSKLFSEYGFDYNIQSFDDVNKLPFLTKDDIKTNFNDLIATNFNDKKILFKTSGSSGNKLEFYGDDSMYKKEAAYILHSFNSHGSNLYDDWTIWIRRHSPKNENDLVVKDYELKRIYVSPFHLNDDNILFYVDLINNSKVKTIVTYPSTAYWLSCLLEKHNLKLANIQSIHGASEKCLDVWSDKIKKVFGFNIKMHYGQVEKVSFMYQSNISDFYHNDMTYSYTQISDDNSIVGTSFMNYVMPFIRYKTNDIVTLNKNVQFDSSRPLLVSDINGRADDMIVAKNDSRIPSVNFYTLMSKKEDVKMFQLYQKLDKSLILKISTNNNINDNIFNELKFEILKRVGDLPLEIKIVDKIERDRKTGKLRCVITEIK